MTVSEHGGLVERLDTAIEESLEFDTESQGFYDTMLTHLLRDLRAALQSRDTSPSGGEPTAGEVDGFPLKARIWKRSGSVPEPEWVLEIEGEINDTYFISRPAPCSSRRSFPPMTANPSEYPSQQRNLNPHAEARLAMALWSQEYAFEQKGGSMDFWGSRTPSQKRLCIDIINGILEAHEENGRAPETPHDR